MKFKFNFKQGFYCISNILKLAYLVKNDFRPGDKAKIARFADGPCNNSIKNEVNDKGKCRTTFFV